MLSEKDGDAKDGRGAEERLSSPLQKERLSGGSRFGRIES